MLRAESAVAALPPGSAPALETLRGKLGRGADAAARQADTLRQGVQRADPELIVWLSTEGRGPRVRVAPLEVAHRLEDELWSRRDSVLATSATLTTQGTFDFSVRRLGLLHPTTLDVGSPFDYQRAVLVLVVNDLPEPDAPDHEAAAQRVLAAAARAADGRTLALFTSHGAVRATAAALRGPLAADGVGLLAHDIDGGPARLLRALAERPRSLVLGTAAFWEGVDVRGPALSQLVMTRLPFPVPTDPIHAARAALHDDPFAEYTLPQAVLRFRQGFGRLIRGPDERGVFLILDRRVTSRRYGEVFLEALPECERQLLPGRRSAGGGRGLAGGGAGACLARRPARACGRAARASRWFAHADCRPAPASSGRSATGSRAATKGRCPKRPRGQAATSCALAASWLACSASPVGRAAGRRRSSGWRSTRRGAGTRSARARCGSRSGGCVARV